MRAFTQLVERSRADLAHVRAQNTRLRGAAHRITDAAHGHPPPPAAAANEAAASISPTRRPIQKPAAIAAMSRQPSAADLRRNPHAPAAAHSSNLGANSQSTTRPPLDLATLNASRSFIFGD
jgi:hypothetical protein